MFIYKVYFSDKCTKYAPEEYDCRIDLAALHADELIKDRYKDGKKIKAREYTKGPRKLEKQVLCERRFIKGIEQDYFDELMSDLKEQSRKRSLLGSDEFEPKQKKQH